MLREDLEGHADLRRIHTFQTSSAAWIEVPTFVSPWENPVPTGWSRYNLRKKGPCQRFIRREGRGRPPMSGGACAHMLETLFHE
ncbi:hypothetical protein TRAPUB_4567 [Trametes pubescens]|uniref:Uncharacterized protein n=1 Tax=Trametes pubescens TaxID=154538 RepID=A0A1M2VB72_TRAPU|nr:hypothetical protein TRAPUB_4567 [Trametes pubescens]